MNWLRVRDLLVEDEPAKEYIAITNTKTVIDIVQSDSAEIDLAKVNLEEKYSVIKIYKDKKVIAEMFVIPQTEVIINEYTEELRDYINKLLEDVERWIVECLQS